MESLSTWLRRWRQQQQDHYHHQVLSYNAYRYQLAYYLGFPHMINSSASLLLIVIVASFLTRYSFWSSETQPSIILLGCFATSRYKSNETSTEATILLNNDVNYKNYNDNNKIHNYNKQYQQLEVGERVIKRFVLTEATRKQILQQAMAEDYAAMTPAWRHWIIVICWWLSTLIFSEEQQRPCRTTTTNVGVDNNFSEGITNSSAVRLLDECCPKAEEDDKSSPRGMPTEVLVLGPQGTVIIAPWNAGGERLSCLIRTILEPFSRGFKYVTGNQVSIVIAARDEEAFLVRTLQFVFETTAANHLREVIIVDDGSLLPVQQLVDMQLPTVLRSKVTVYRLESRQGLIRARILGARSANAANIVFLDAHCRPQHNWYPPLLRHLKANYRTLVSPIIEDIHPETWEPIGTYGMKMMFDWSGLSNLAGTKIWHKKFP